MGYLYKDRFWGRDIEKGEVKNETVYEPYYQFEIFERMLEEYLPEDFMIPIDMEERKKLRRIKHFLKKKIKDLFRDHRIAGIVSGFMLLGLPLFLGYESANPIFFGMYSAKLMIVNTVYVIGFLYSIGLFLYLLIKK